jgi:hypothetical protein
MTMLYKIKRICIKKWKFCIVVNFFIWILIKNHLCDIKSEKIENVLMLIDSKKYKTVKNKKIRKQ